MILNTLKSWIHTYIKDNIHEWIKDILEALIVRIDAHEAELNQVNTKLDNDYAVLSELAGADYPEQVEKQRQQIADELEAEVC